MAEDLDALFGAFDGAQAKEDDMETSDDEGEEEGEEGEEEGEEEEEGVEEEGEEEEGKDEKGAENDANEDSKSDAEPPSKKQKVAPPTKKVVPKKSKMADNSEFQTTNSDEVVLKALTHRIVASAAEDEPQTETDAATPKEEKAISTGTSHDKSIRHYSALPDNHIRVEPPSSTPPAKSYPFPLDPFQQTAIAHIHANESVLVAAHTSAGKTAVAEYAVATSLKAGQRVIYTSPIKALSNQKYRDLSQEFTDVGLMTGDITINPSATALVMTTEILRSMLYRGSEIMREVAWVIYDEVHYMRDSERGVVWEESIILLPHRVRFVFLSATIPNASQFADWICKIHHQPCHVVYTNYRPVPLQHYIFPAGGSGLHLVVDEKGKFREGNFQRAMAALQGTDETSGIDANSGGGKGNNARNRGNKKGNPKQNATTDLHRIVKLIMERQLNPVIVFSFSKKDCERYALGLHKEDYSEDVEKDLISQVYANAIESLSDDDKKLPQVEALLPLLKRGIGIHHGGLLPILKEIVEILFSEGLIKVLFATETFSIGINMPAKTVVFTNTRKWDGVAFRWVTSGEYIQMSGRAGRRGKDDRGIVIQMMDEKMDPAVCKGILYGDPDPLNSSYKISYNMLLNMMRVEDVDPEYLIRASFHQFQQECEAPALEAKAEELEKKANRIEFLVEEETSDGDGDTGGSAHNSEGKVREFYDMNKQLEVAQSKMRKIIRKAEHINPFLQPGRLIDATLEYDTTQSITTTKNKMDIDENEQRLNFGWGVVVSKSKQRTGQSAGTAGKQAEIAAGIAGTKEHVLEVLCRCVDRKHDDPEPENEELIAQPPTGLLWRGSTKTCRPVSTHDKIENVEVRLFTMGLDAIQRISAVRIYVPPDVHPPKAREDLGRNILEVLRRFKKKDEEEDGNSDASGDGLPILHPIKDMKIKSDDFDKLVSRANTLTERLSQLEQHWISSSKNSKIDDALESLTKSLKLYGQKATLLEQSSFLRKEVKGCETMVMKETLKKMKKVLKKIDHVDLNGVIQTKGRTACEINTANELVVVELVFSGVFAELSVEQSCALLSCMTFDEKKKGDDDDPSKGLKSYLANPFAKLKEAARLVARASIDCKMDGIDEDEFVEKFNPGMMEAVFAWCKGAKFVDVQKLTGSFEGTTIRTLRRLEELVRQLANASKAIGNHELQTKFEKGSEMIKRDIVFCSSLYL